MKKQRARSSASLISPQGHGLASGSAEAHGLPSSRQSHSLNSPQSAKAYAFFLLKFRLRSEKELEARLKQKGFSLQLSQDTVNFLKEKEFIDDRVFAKAWVASRLKRQFGLRRIKQELIQKGISKEIIEDLLVEAKECFSESQTARQLAQERFLKLKNIEPQKARARVYGYLMRRGFSPEIVSEIVNKLKAI